MWPVSDAAISQDVSGTVASRKSSALRVGVTPGGLPAVIALKIYGKRLPLINERTSARCARIDARH